MPQEKTAEQNLAVIVYQIKTLHEEFVEMKGVLRDLAGAVTRLALIEERQSQAMLAQDRTIKEVETLEERIDVLERAAPLQAQTSGWVTNAVWAAAVLSVGIALKKLGLM